MSKTAGDRDELHRLIDKLPPEFNVSDDPLLDALRNAPADDEAESDAERAASERARHDIGEGKTLSHDEIRAKVG